MLNYRTTVNRSLAVCCSAIDSTRFRPHLSRLLQVVAPAHDRKPGGRHIVSIISEFQDSSGHVKARGFDPHRPCLADGLHVYRVALQRNDFFDFLSKQADQFWIVCIVRVGYVQIVNGFVF